MRIRPLGGSFDQLAAPHNTTAYGTGTCTHDDIRFNVDSATRSFEL